VSVKQLGKPCKECRRPTYEYKCKEHGHIFEVEQKMSDPTLATGEVCGTEVERLIGMRAIFCKDSANSPYKEDFRSNPHKWEATCESAFRATKKDKGEIKKTGIKSPIPGCNSGFTSQFYFADAGS
jgi:putative FmdB family regulatory protein